MGDWVSVGFLEKVKKKTFFYMNTFLDMVRSFVTIVHLDNKVSMRLTLRYVAFINTSLLEYTFAQIYLPDQMQSSGILPLYCCSCHHFELILQVSSLSILRDFEKNNL